MCGIVGYVGRQNAVPVLIEGLRKLEYRGYDSAGVAFYENGSSDIVLRKAVGKLSNLEKVLSNGHQYESRLGIGHTRWATHGKPSDVNAHPHSDTSGKVVVVHNGIIENYHVLKKRLVSEGCLFRSDTDTEVLAHLVAKHLNGGGLAEAVRSALKEIEGTYALAVICSADPERIVAARKGSPLVVGMGQGEYMIASDVPAILSHTKDAIFVNDNEMVVLNKDGVEIIDMENGRSKPKNIHRIPWDCELAEKNGYPHFMLKEIHEQPGTIRNTCGSVRVNGDNEKEIEWEGIALTVEEVEKINRIYLVSCGTSWHASLVGKFMIEALARIPVEVDLASEFRYRSSVIDEGALTIGITQSGETADTLGAMRKAKEEGSKVFVVCNVVGSTATREADGVIYTHAGPEIGVASTKAFTSQLAALYLFALYLGKIKGKIERRDLRRMLGELDAVPGKIEQIIKKEEEIERLAGLCCSKDSFFFIGRGVMHPIALEGALKLKEISYLHAEGYAAGEMKHGPIALVDKDMVVVSLAPHNSVYEKILGNIEEVKARDGIVVALATEGDEAVREKADHVFYVPESNDYLSSILYAVPLQLLAYHIARNKGCDIDQPRNLAKSVTVE